MKNIIPVLLLTMAGQLLAQPAYQIAAEISSVDSILLKDNIDQIIEAQFTAEQITETQRLAIISVVEFVNEPFGSEIIYENISPEAAILMHDLVIDNRKRKQEVGYNIYTTLRESNCVEELPGKYSDFLIDDLIIFTDEQLACYKKLRSSKKSEEPVWEELLEFQPEAPARAVPSPTIESPSPGFPSLPSKIIDATAQFLVDRVKEEFMLAFFNQFLERMDNSAELKGLFPNTFILLNTQDIFKVPSMGKVWVSAFEEDLKSVHYNFDQLVQTNPTYQELKSQPGFQIFSILNFAFYQIGQKNSYSLKMLDEFRDRYGNRETIVGRHIELLHRVLSNLRGSDEEIVGLDSYKTNLFQSGKNATKYFAALIIAQDRSLFHAIKFKGKSAELSLADVLQSQFFEFCLKLGELSILANRLKSSSENLQQALQDKANQPGEYYFAYIQLLESVFDLVDFAFALKYISDPEAIYTAKYYTSYKPIAQNTIRSLKAAIEKNYGLILVYALQTIEPLIEQRVLQYETELEVLKAKLERNEISASSFQTSEKKHKKKLKNPEEHGAKHCFLRRIYGRCAFGQNYAGNPFHHSQIRCSSRILPGQAGCSFQF